VFDSFGTLVFTANVANANGTMSETYSGPALQAGMYYQLRISALKIASQLSQTEDVAGVFTWQP